MIINYDNIIIEASPDNLKILLLIIKGLDYKFFNEKRRNLIEIIERELEE